MEYFNCRHCDKAFESHSSRDGNSENINQYIKFIGFCKPECWDILDDGEKNKELMFAYINGDKRKRNNFKIEKNRKKII
jgi:hypothetical protein